MAHQLDLAGGCSCGSIRYAITADPLIVHACHCRDCQRVTGSAFVMNLWVESKFVEASGPAPKSFRLAGGSGKPHDVFFCETCGTTVWSRYHIVPGDCLFVRAGTLDDPSGITPDVHIFTRTRIPWVTLPSGARAFEDRYRLDDVWPADKLARLRANAAA